MKSVMIENKKDDVGLREYICKVLARRLAGNYTDSKGERWVLTADQKYQAGSQKGQYKFEEEFDTPVMTITMENGRHWMLKVNDGDIEMIPASSDENGEVWEEVPEEHIYLTLLPEETKKWRYPWTSTQVLTVGDVAGYSKDDYSGSQQGRHCPYLPEHPSVPEPERDRQRQSRNVRVHFSGRNEKPCRQDERIQGRQHEDRRQIHEPRRPQAVQSQRKGY